MTITRFLSKWAQETLPTLTPEEKEGALSSPGDNDIRVRVGRFSFGPKQRAALLHETRLAGADPPTVKTFLVRVKGFDFNKIYVRAKTRGRARAIVCAAFVDAGWGSFREALLHVGSIVQAPQAGGWPLLYPRRGPEGQVQCPT